MATVTIYQRPEWADAKRIHDLFGIGKSALYQLAADGKIKTSSLRERGKTRGKRLFSCDSVAAYIEKFVEEKEADA